MRKLLPVYVRIPLIMAIVFLALEYFIDSGDKPAFMVYPYILVLQGLLLLILIAFEITADAFDSLTYKLMDEQQRAEFDKQNNSNVSFTESAFYKKMMKTLTKSKNLDQESEILLHHDYDGIKELDNDLPPWWVYLFYICIFFGIGYLGYYHLFGGENQVQEYERKNAEALLAIEEWKKTAVDLVDVSNVVAMTDESNLAAGKAIYLERCVACHLVDGGGSIGPNLTDDYWILGGGIKNVFQTISEGGRDGKGMIPWKTELKPSQIQQVASYILTLVGTTPAVGKDAEGDLWKEEGAEQTTESTNQEESDLDAVVE